jgi:hypothetical protein
MKQLQFCLLSLAICAGPAFAQQSKNPVTDVLRDMLAGRQKNIVAAAEAMPADKFGYKPTPEQMSFGHLVTHIIESNNSFCATAADVPEPKVAEAKESDGKDKLVSALKASFDFCGSALPKATDAKLADSIDMFGGKKTRAFAAIVLASSWSDHYGAEAMYLRLNGVLPPTAKKEKD